MGYRPDRSGEDPVTGSMTGQVLDRVARTGTPTVAVWQPRRQVSFGPRDVGHDGFTDAASVAHAEGFMPVEREMGGRPVGMHSDCIALVYGMQPRGTLEERYERLVEAIERAFDEWGVEVERANLDRTFCPGQFSLVADGKIAGFAQRIRNDAVAVGGLIIANDHESVAGVLAPVYDRLGLPFDAGSVGSLARSGLDRPTPQLRIDVERHIGSLAESMRE